MEFKLKNIKIVNGEIGFLQINLYHERPKNEEEKKMCYFVFHNNFDNKNYNSLLEDFIYINKKPVTYIDIFDFVDAYKKTHCNACYKIHSDINYNIHTLLNNYCDISRAYIREPEDEKQIMRIETEKIVEKRVYVDKIVEKVIEKVINNNVIITKDDLDLCSICYEKKAIISFGCCSMKHCLNCTKQICKSGTCSQCRKKIDYTNMQMEIDF